MTGDAQAEAERIVCEYGNAVADTWQEAIDAIAASWVYDPGEVSAETLGRAQEMRDHLVAALAATIEVVDRKPGDWPTVHDTAAPFVTEAEAYEVCRAYLRERLSALRARTGEET